MRAAKQSAGFKDALEYVDKKNRFHNEAIAMADAVIGDEDKIGEDANRAILKNETRTAERLK